MKRRLAVKSVLLAVIIFMMVAMPAYAQMSDPDDTPSMEQIDVYRNMRETGDWLFLYYVNIPYSTTPDEPVTETFIWRLIDTDGTTELGSTVGFAYDHGGYGYNVYSMYFSAADATALGLVWGTSYTLRLSGNPAHFTTPPEYNYTVDAGDYTSFVTQDDVQTALAANILGLAADLNVNWGLGATDSLLTELETGQALSIYGETVFRGCIYGVQALAPAIFSVVIRTIDPADRTWGTGYTDNVTTQWSGTWVDTAREGGKALTGTSYDLISVIIFLILSAGLLVGNVMLTGNHWNGMIDVAAWGVVAARWGMYDFLILLLIAALCIIYISSKIWFGVFR